MRGDAGGALTLVMPKKAKAPGGSTTSELLDYLFGPGELDEHTDPHLVAGWDPDLPCPARHPERIPPAPPAPALWRAAPPPAGGPPRGRWSHAPRAGRGGGAVVLTLVEAVEAATAWHRAQEFRAQARAASDAAVPLREAAGLAGTPAPTAGDEVPYRSRAESAGPAGPLPHPRCVRWTGL
ncbi:hypothetical protein ACFVFI_37125 [Streptomyces sp. NPDC057705]|uniref:hypothetical protein n=1 Tax=Streptomyces sp. NPDC057705 TaxID=3346222 RepID=UPI0036C26FA8